jgi:hypothetical protein
MGFILAMATFIGLFFGTAYIAKIRRDKMRNELRESIQRKRRQMEREAELVRAYATRRAYQRHQARHGAFNPSSRVVETMRHAVSKGAQARQDEREWIASLSNN